VTSTSRLAQNIELLVSALGNEARRADDLEKQILRLENEVHAAQTSRLASVARASNAAAPAQSSNAGGRAAVIAWDAGHNPVGRAYVLQRLLSPDWRPVLIAPSWRRYGKGLWSPLREIAMETRIFACDSLLDFYAQAAIEATKEKFDIVYVSKPRLPSLFLGFLIKEHSGCPMLLDVDDHELSFFQNQTQADLDELRRAGVAALIEPFEELATRFCETLIPRVDAVTVSNSALRDRFGGVIVRHARDEASFDPARFDRTAVRKELGVSDNEFSLIFVGTVRPHKGVTALLQALDELADPEICLHIVGDGAPAELSKTLKKFEKARVVLHRSWSFEDLPWLLSAADCVPLLQDTANAIACYQLPSKVSDATAMGIPVLVTDAPPLKDLKGLPGFHVTSRETLKESILALKAARDSVNRKAIRAGFLGEFGEAVNRARLKSAIAEIKNVEPLPQEFHELRKLMASALGEAGRAPQPHFPIPAIGGSRRAPTNIAFFWKQNDTGIYGRRADMIAKYLLRSDEIGKMLFFDAPMSIAALSDLARKADASPANQSALVLRNTIARWERSLDHSRLLQRSYIHRCDSTTRLLGRDLPDAAGFPDFVRQELREAGFIAEETIAWVCPVVWQFPQVYEEIGFRACVADIIDDQRSWDIQESYRKKLDELYSQTLSRADLTLANCAPVAAGFEGYSKSPIHIVPNGAERFDSIADKIAPFELKAVERPIIGYVGNLRDRIDWSLLEELAQRRPNWSFVFAGSAEENPNVASLAKYANVKFLGVVEYSLLPSLLKSFDVAIVPHVLNDLTRAMNPLKVYNYLAAGIPVVSTAIPNVNEVADLIRIADNADDFISAIESCLATPRQDAEAGRRDDILASISWDARVAEILRLLDPYLIKEPASHATTQRAESHG